MANIVSGDKNERASASRGSPDHHQPLPVTQDQDGSLVSEPEESLSIDSGDPLAVAAGSQDEVSMSSPSQSTPKRWGSSMFGLFSSDSRQTTRQKKVHELREEVDQLKEKLRGARRQGNNLRRSLSEETRARSQLEKQLGQQRAEFTKEYHNQLRANRDVQQRLDQQCRTASELKKVYQYQLTANSELENKLSEAQNGKHALQDTVNHLRGMLIPKTETEVLDSEVTKKFRLLRSSVFKFVKKACNSKVERNSFTVQQPGCLFLEPKSSPRARENYFRGAVFRELYCSILRDPCFDLGGPDQHLSLKLVELENQFQNAIPADKQGDVIRWRQTTLQCLGHLNTQPSSLPDEVAANIWKFLSPALKENQGAQDEGFKILQEVCQDTFALALLVRRSDDRYRVINDVGDTEGRLNDNLAEHVDDHPCFEPRKNGTFAFCHFGALVKCTGKDSSPFIVLEKAEAVMFEFQGSKSLVGDGEQLPSQ